MAAANGACRAVSEAVLADRIKGALYGLLIAEALAAPTHWFYGGERQVAATYGGPVTGFVKPVTHLPGSIMSKSNTGGGGRGGYSGDVIGKIIFHGKKKYWAPGADYHYHHMLEAGDNALEGLLARRVVAVTAAAGGRFDEQAILDDYVAFMTTPDTHNDTYCGTSHRMFFANHASGKPLNKCPDNDRHNVDAACALVTTVPVALTSADDEEAARNARRMVRLTRESPESERYADVLAEMIRHVVRGGTAREAAALGGKRLRYDVERAASTARQDPMTACYLDSSFPAALLMTFKYGATDGSGAGEAFRRGVLANANRGGENVNTGAVLGALLGAEAGFSRLPADLVQGLAPGQAEAVRAEVDAFVRSVPLAKAAAAAAGEGEGRL